MVVEGIKSSRVEDERDGASSPGLVYSCRVRVNLAPSKRHETLVDYIQRMDGLDVNGSGEGRIVGSEVY